MIKCSFIYVTTMNNNISYDLRTFLSLTTEKKQSILDYVQLPFHKLIFRHYWQMMSDILKTSYTEAIFKWYKVVQVLPLRKKDAATSMSKL